MATAVLHVRDQKSCFFTSAEHPSPAASSNGGAFTPVSEALPPPVTRHGRDAAICSKIHNRRGSMLSRNNSAVGLLASPGQARPIAQKTHHRDVGPRNSAGGFSEIMGSNYGRKHSLPSHLSLHGSEMLISRQLSVPLLDHAADVQMSERFHLHEAQLHGRKPLQHDAIFPSNPAQSMPSHGGRTTVSYQKLKLSASSRFQDMFCLKQTPDLSAHYRKRLHPEVSQIEVDRQCGKSAVKVLADWPERSISTNISIANGKHLSRLASGKGWERSETQMPADKVGKKMEKSMSDGVVGVHTDKNGSSKLTSFKLPVISSGDVGRVGIMRTYNKSAGSSAGKLKSAIELEGMPVGHGSVLDTDEIWVSVMKDEMWAGPSFFNSPPPSSLPVPSFTFLLSRAPSASFKSCSGVGATVMVPNKSSLQASSHTWDPASATKDLRRMLHLDNTAVEV